MRPTTRPVVDQLPLRLGASGAAVKDLQVRLRRTGFLELADASGDYDAATQQAISDFQTRAGLQTTGVCDESTWSAIVEAGYSLGDRLLYHRIPMLRGDDVGALQRRLSELGFHSGRVDGIFGPESESAVKAFQRNTGLVTDGVAGPDVVAQLRRLGPGSATITKAVLAERIKLLEAPHDLRGARIAVGEPGTLPAFTHTIASHLDATGAMTLAIHHPDGSAAAGEANRFDAHCFVGCTSRSTPGARIAFYQTEGYESAGGRHLANVVARHLRDGIVGGDVIAQGMRLPILRETRMPALWCEIGPPNVLVEHAAQLAAVISAGIAEWVFSPVEDDTNPD